MIVGSAPAIDALRAQILHLAAFDTPRRPNVPTVLLQGETGTGKGLVARAIHASGGRARGPFIDVNCAAIPETMLEAELFGFEAGAFTDAKRAKPGLFEAASGGSLFLDEVDALPVTLQGKLLKAIEEKHIRRLGAVAPQRVDVKLIAATQRNLLEMAGAGGFRADLYHRLAVVVLELPPLRERPEDVLVLAQHFLAEHAAGHGLAPKRLDDGARRWLAGHPWPGNVRELANLMERVTLLSLTETIDADALERLRIPLYAPARSAGPSPAAGSAAAAAPGNDDEAERIRDALARSGGNVVGAARLLGIGRNALRHRMQRHGIARPTLEALATSTRAPLERSMRNTEAPGLSRGGTSPLVHAAPGVSPATAPAASSWEVKPVAVLAIDVVLPERGHDPWTMARRWADRIVERVAGFGGVFLTRTPSRLTAVFGAPRALEQLPQRAVQAALAIHRLLDAADPAPELRMAAHLGSLRVDAGAADPIASALPLGDTVAAAERLLGHAGAGEVLVTAQVARRVEGVVRTALARAASRRSRLAARRRRDRAATAAGGRRARAPDALRRAGSASWRSSATASRAPRPGHGLVVFVVGDAGIGKSRLLAELRRAIAGEPHLWIEGRCASYGTTTAFLPIVDGLRRFFAIDDRDDDARRRRQDRATASRRSAPTSPGRCRWCGRC